MLAIVCFNGKVFHLLFFCINNIILTFVKNINVMRASEVFIAGGMPRVTYNPRNDLKLEDTLKDYLDNGYKLISVTGPTKSGKTVLVNKVISTDNCILISGGSITQDTDFWNIILDELEVCIPDSQTVAE